MCTHCRDSLSRTLYCGLLNLGTPADSHKAALANVAFERYSAVATCKYEFRLLQSTYQLSYDLRLCIKKKSVIKFPLT
jgi:hypothetical protein